MHLLVSAMEDIRQKKKTYGFGADAFDGLDGMEENESRRGE